MHQNRSLVVLLLAVLMIQTGCSGKAAANQPLRAKLADRNAVWARTIVPGQLQDAKGMSPAALYEVEARYDPAAQTVTGVERVLFVNQTNQPIPILHLTAGARNCGPSVPTDNLKISDVRVDDQPADFLTEYAEVSYTFPHDLPPGQSVRLSFNLTSHLPVINPPKTYQAAVNVPLSDCPFFGAGPDLTNLTVFPVVMGAAGEGDVRVPALLDLHLTVPAGWTVASSGAQVDQPVISSGEQQVHIAAAAPEGFAVFAGANLRQVSRDVKGVRLTSYYPPEVEAYGKQALDEGAAALSDYLEVLGPIPFREVNLLCVPGAMEIGGEYLGGGLAIVTQMHYSDYHRALPSGSAAAPLAPLVDVDMPSDRKFVIAHELAHIWWGDLSRYNTAPTPWMSESLATTSALYTLERGAGPALAGSVRQRLKVSYEAMRLAGLPDEPLNLPRMQYVGMEQEHLIMYNKGPLFWDGLRHTMGDDQFFHGLRAYLTEHRYQIIDGDGPVADLRKEPGQADAVDRLYDRWVKGTNADVDIGRLDLHDAALIQALQQAWHVQ